jgi:hypothetical protein
MLQELQLRRQLKARSTRLATIEKSRIRQHSRLAYIQSGDANINFFSYQSQHKVEEKLRSLPAH